MTERPDQGWAVVGLGAMSAFGRGVEALWRGVAEGREAIRPVRRFPTDAFGARIAALVPEALFDGVEAGGGDPATAGEAATARAVHLTVAAAREALADAAVPAQATVGMVLGTSHLDGGVHHLARRVAAALGLGGPVVTVSTACASSTNALGPARDLLRSGAADVVLLGGADLMTVEIFAGFDRLGLLCAEPCGPFGEREGTSLGEGAAFVVLAPVGGSARPRATLLGHGSANDGWHATTPDPTGKGMARALTAALADAGLGAEAVDYVNAHGTGTRANDASEWRGLQRALGPRADGIPISATKSILGHAQGAAGALELVTTLCALEHGQVPPTRHHGQPRPHAPPDVVAGDRPRPHTTRVFVSCNAAFGGVNTAAVFAAPGVPTPPRRPVERRPLRIGGAGAVSPGGLGVDALGPHPEALRGRVAPFDLRAVVPGLPARRTDPATRHLAAAVRGALDGGEARPSTGLFVVQPRLSPQVVDAFHARLDRGIEALSPSIFARMVLNAGAGTCARLFDLHGPTNTLAAGCAGGLFALVHAAELLSHTPETGRMVVAAVDELPADADDPRAVEGGAALRLDRDDRSEPGPRLLGWGLAPPGRLEDAAAAARAMAGPAAVEALPPSTGGPPMGPLWQLAVAARRPGRHLIAADDPAALAVAVVIEGAAP